MRIITLSILLLLITGAAFLGPVQQQVIAQDTTSLSAKISNDELVVQFCSYFGGDREEWSNDVCFTDDGGFVISGMTRSDGLPVVSAFQGEYGGAGDVFLVKISAQFQVEFYTYYGGNGLEEPMALTIDDEGNIILAGGTSSDNLTLLNPIQDVLNGTSDAFIAKFNPSGGLIFATYLGGSDVDRIEDIYIDSDGNYLVTGPTSSDDFYTTSGTHQESYGGGNSDVFITLLSGDGQSIIYSTYFGDSTDEDAWEVGMDALDNPVIIGITNGDAVATSSAFQQSYGGGQTDSFVAKFTPNCASLSWATLLGGDGWEFGDQVEFDSDNNIVVSGYTGSSDFPIVDQLFNDSYGYDAFFCKLSPDGENLLFSSYLGGTGEDRSYAMEVLDDDSILITSPTASANMPLQNALQNHSGASDGYMALFGGESLNLLFGSYFGGGSNDYVLGMSVYKQDMVAVIGYTFSDDLPVFNAVQDSYRGSSDTMVWVFGFQETDTQDPPIILMVTILVAAIALVLVIGLRRVKYS